MQRVVLQQPDFLFSIGKSHTRRETFEMKHRNDFKKFHLENDHACDQFSESNLFFSDITMETIFYSWSFFAFIWDAPLRTSFLLELGERPEEMLGV